MDESALRPAYRYRARLVRVIDGDTYELDIDLGFHVWVRQAVRLRGYDAPERGTPEGRRLTWAAARLLEGRPLLVETQRRAEADVQSFARYVADVWVEGRPVGEALALPASRR